MSHKPNASPFTKERNHGALLLASGLLLLFPFATLSAILYWSEVRQAPASLHFAHNRILPEPQLHTFARLERGEIQRTAHGNYYFFSYRIENHLVSRRGIEQVDADFYNRNSEGKSVEALLYRHPNGDYSSRLRHNRLPAEPRSRSMQPSAHALTLLALLFCLIAFITLRGKERGEAAT